MRMVMKVMVMMMMMHVLLWRCILKAAAAGELPAADTYRAAGIERS